MDPAKIPLKDIHLPPAIEWWPIADAWWFLAAALVAGAIALGIFWQWRKRQRLKRTALQELDAIEQGFREHQDSHRLARELSGLARRVAIAHSGDAAAETGDAWRQRLNSLSNADALDSKIIKNLSVAAYAPSASLNADSSLQAFRTWLSQLKPISS